MPKYTLRYARSAEDDLNDIGAYLERERGLVFASGFLGGPWKAIESLSGFVGWVSRSGATT